MTKTSPEQLTPDAMFVLDYADGIDRSAPIEVQDREDSEAIAFARQLEAVDERLVVLNALMDRARDRSGVAAAVELAEDDKYGHGFLEVSRDEMPKAVGRMLAGKNPFVVVRASEWGGQSKGDTGDAIAREMSGRVGLRKALVEKFPKPGMVKGSSDLHLDNFINSTHPGFRYAMSASQIEKGSALFIGGFARGSKALNTTPKNDGVFHPYEDKKLKLETSPGVSRVYGLAANDKLKKTQVIELDPVDSTDLTAVVLHEGDVVIWGQGGLGCKTPDWHAFRQIGTDTDRKSTSYHFAQQLPPTQTTNRLVLA